MFSHPVGSTGHIVHSGVSGAQNVDAPFFMLRSARHGIHTKRAGKHYAELVFFAFCGVYGSCNAFHYIRGKKCYHTIFQALVGPVQFP
jgi:hypothetical protein